MKKQKPNWVFEIKEYPCIEGWLHEGSAKAEWEHLFNQTDSASVFLSPDFASIWLRHYKTTWTPLLIVAHDCNGSLRGLMPLATRGTFITGLGANQAEYQGWLSHSYDNIDFIQGAIKTLFNRFPKHHLRLRYILPGAGSKAARQLANKHPNIMLTAHNRPLMRLTDRQANDALRKKSNKSKYNRLARQGNLVFQQATKYDDFAKIFDQITTIYDFRQGAKNGICPFLDDKLKKPFHLDWFRTAAEHLHVTYLCLDKKVISAIVGVNINHQMAIAILAFTPEHALNSPSKLNIYKTAHILAHDSQKIIDLTPGGNWKERFSTDNEDVLELNAYASIKHARTILYKNAFFTFGVRILKRAGISPLMIKNKIKRIRRINRTKIATRVRGWKPRRIEYLVYKIDLSQDFDIGDSARARKNDLSALIQFKPTHSWQTRKSFLSQALNRIQSGIHSYTVLIDDELAHYGWLADTQTNSFFTEVGQFYTYPTPGPVLYDFFTAVSARNKGLYQSTILQMLADLKHRDVARIAYISVLSDNAPSRHVIEKIGFKAIASLQTTSCFGATIKAKK